MFDQRIDSPDTRRRCLLFVATAGGYLLLILIGGAASILAYRPNFLMSVRAVTAIAPPPPPYIQTGAGHGRRSGGPPRRDSVDPSRPLEAVPIRIELPTSDRRPFPEVEDGANVDLSGQSSAGGGERRGLFDSFGAWGSDPAGRGPVPIPEVTQPVHRESPAIVRKTSQLTMSSATAREIPEYPSMARHARIEGPVEVEVTISENGSVEEARVLRGHPFLRASALLAARRWRFSPTRLGGQAVKAVGIITFRFRLGG